MKSVNRRLGDFIKQFDERAKDSQIRFSLEDIVGISSITKQFVPTKANLVGVNVDSYKVVPPGYFAYNPNTARMGDKVCIALNQGDKPLLVSSIYPVFSVDREVLLPEYLLLWLKRAEFDRWARFVSHGSAREVLDWERLCELGVPVPSIDEQRKIVHDYHVITDRIEILREMNEDLEEVAYLLFRQFFAGVYGAEELPDGWGLSRLEDLCEVKGGKRLPADRDLICAQTNHPYIRVRDVGDMRYVCLTDQFQYIDDETYDSISRYTVKTGDIVISIVGTIGLIGKIHHSLNGANLTENCVKLTNIHSVTGDYLYYTLRYKKETKEFELLTVGAVQAKLPIYNIQSIEIVIPPENVIERFQSQLEVFNLTVEANSLEIQKLRELTVSFLSRMGKGV